MLCCCRSRCGLTTVSPLYSKLLKLPCKNNKKVIYSSDSKFPPAGLYTHVRGCLGPDLGLDSYKLYSPVLFLWLVVTLPILSALWCVCSLCPCPLQCSKYPLRHNYLSNITLQISPCPLPSLPFLHVIMDGLACVLDG